MSLRSLAFFTAMLVALASLSAGESASGAPREPEGLPLAEVYRQSTLREVGTFGTLVEDSRGFLYIGDRGNLWEFDGLNVRLVETSRRLQARVLVRDFDGAVLSGNADEFKRISADATGRFTVSPIPVQADATLSKINAIHPTASHVYVVCEGGIAVWDRQSPAKTHSIPAPAFTSFLWKDQLYAAFDGLGLARFDLVSGWQVVIKAPDSPLGIGIFQSLTTEAGVMLGSADRGLGLFDGQRIHRLPSQPNWRFRRPIAPVALPAQRRLIFSEDSGRLILLDADQPERWWSIDPVAAFGAGRPRQLLTDSRGGVWVASDTSLTRLHFDWPYRVFGADAVEDYSRIHPSNEGITVSSADQLHDVADVGGELGQMARREVEAGARAVLAQGRFRFVAFEDRVEGWTDGRLVATADARLGSLMMSSYVREGRFFLVAGTDLWAAEADASGWNIRKIATNLPQTYLIRDQPDGSIWGEAGSGLVWRSTGDGGPVVKLDSRHGLPSKPWVAVESLWGSALFATTGSCYRYDEATGRFVVDTKLKAITGDLFDGIGRVTESPRGDILLLAKNQLRLLRRKPDGQFARDDQALTPLQSDRAWYTIADQQGRFWMVHKRRAVRFDPRLNLDAGPRPDVVITRIQSPDGTEPMSALEERVSLPYSRRDLSFHFSAPMFGEQGRGLYRSRLHGYEADWTPWSPMGERHFTNLPEGNYRFTVEAMDMFGRRGRTGTVAFGLQPPVYRTWWAYLGYAVGGLALFGVASRSRNRWLLRRNAALAREVSQATREIRERNHELTGALAQAEQLAIEARAAAEAKSLFLANMSHEIRTPMNGVIGMSSLLADTPLTAEQRDFVSTIRHSSESLLGIINDILDFSKIESGQLALEHIPLDVATLVEDVFDLIAPEADRKGLELVLRFDPALSTARLGDPTRLRQILINLVSNAVKFTTVGEITVTLQDVSGAHPGSGPLAENTISFAITDTGMGMPEEKRGLLFHPFSQIDASTTRRFGGTGLGLAISRRLVERMGGEISCESQLGQGTTFRFQVALPKDPATPPGNPDAVVLRGTQVLWIDDCLARGEAQTAYLRHLGVSAVHCTVSNAAGTWNPTARFDCVVFSETAGSVSAGSALAALVSAAAKPVPPILLLSHRRASAVSAMPGESSVVISAALPQPPHRSAMLGALAEWVGRRGSAAEPNAGHRLAPIAPIAELGGLRVLLAEDNAVNQKMALIMLQRLGIRADLAGNGLEALQALERQPYDVILMDIQMPELDGLEATRKIRRTVSAERQPYIIAVTAGVAELDQRACREAGMDAFIAKPFKVAQLTDALSVVKSPGKHAA